MDEAEKTIFPLIESIAGTSLISIRIFNEGKSRLFVSPGIRRASGPGISKKSLRIPKTVLPDRGQDGVPWIIEDSGDVPGLSHLRTLGIRSLAVVSCAEKKRRTVFICFYRERLRNAKKRLAPLGPACRLAASLLTRASEFRAASALANLASTDGLTGMYNYRYFSDSMNRELMKAERFHYPVSLAMIDIDHFKKYNDALGHPRGDIVLKELAGIINRSKRSYDIAARYGGDEFILILPYTNRSQAIVLLERIRKETAVHDFPGGRNAPRITISAGICSFPENTRLRSELIRGADQALYLAKGEGKNRTCTSLTMSQNTVRLAICRPTITVSPFYPDILRGVQDVIKDVGKVELDIVVYDKNLGHKKQLAITGALIDRKIDAVGISAMAGVELKDHIAEFNAAGIPTFLFNTPRNGDIGRIISCIGFNHREAGVMIARYIIRILRNKGKIAIIEGFPEAASMETKDGFVETLRNTGIEILDCRSGEWALDKARDIAGDLIRRYPDIDAIWGENDEMALGATDAIAAAGRLGKVLAIGADGSRNAFESIRMGQLTATLNKNPIEIGKLLMRTVIRNMIKEEKVEPYIQSPVNMVDLENVDESLKSIV